MVLLAYRHGLRAAEVVDLRWEQVDFKTASLHIRRTKNGTPATHPLSGVRCASSAAISGKARRRLLCLSRNAAPRYRRARVPSHGTFTRFVRNHMP
jgi:integrase